ncbi:SDR family NAD(P)-dependent oxidoreductase [Legionella jamestowniensis]|uniref:Sepiapterin reductase n=1 Tax=Legionella jamestowniensis TaxID=455 RepID=A0A0W0UZT6_9GAMM|nr:SDR family NAD(P)-dependent oxidoreductase [Legionella jamestowniensis]KTD13365.1 sepiapterin reductase [Legionella jamestowniensis]SFL76437.1 NAD(P)-dependent dehydrogenase, short-chain alcohol dehydrogenase family [Legionella jamestowniensis DSM 19215]
MFVITGGGSGIGRALAKNLAMQGKKILIVGRREKVLAKTASFSPLISYLAADVATKEGREQIATALQSTASIEGLVHNAGTIEPIAPIAEIDELSWQQTLATNLNAPLFLTQLLLPKLKGRVLNIGSGAAYFPVTGWAAYCVSKAGLSMLTRCWQLESHGTAFASVMPGIIDTDMQALIRQAQCMDIEKQNFFHILKAEQRLLTTETVALFLSWLLLKVSRDEFVAREWDIYDKSHHQCWLIPPHQVPEWEE